MSETVHWRLSAWSFTSERLINHQCCTTTSSPALVRFLSTLKHCSLFRLGCWIACHVRAPSPLASGLAIKDGCLLSLADSRVFQWKARVSETERYAVTCHHISATPWRMERVVGLRHVWLLSVMPRNEGARSRWVGSHKVQWTHWFFAVGEQARSFWVIYYFIVVVEKETLDKVCDMKMNRWANGTCFCVLSLKRNSG